LNARSPINDPYRSHNHTGLFRRRRKSESSHESDDDDDDNVELNTSDENVDESDDDDSVYSSDHDTIQQLANGDVRIRGLNSEGPNEHRSEQTLLLEDEDVEITIRGYRYNRLNLLLYRICSIATLGIAWLVFRWVPTWWVAWVGEMVPLKDAEWLVVEVMIFADIYFNNNNNKTLGLKYIYNRVNIKRLKSFDLFESYTMAH
jgi:cation-transporting ATPase 13A3/4/5